VLSATSLLNNVGKRKGALHDWTVALLARKPARDRSVGQQACPDRLGDDENRRRLPRRDIRKNVRRAARSAHSAMEGALGARLAPRLGTRSKEHSTEILEIRVGNCEET
jgi:hypothetical protein